MYSTYEDRIQPHQTCPECQAILQPVATCEDYFHQLLYWENKDHPRGEVHHITVLSCHLQLPSLYSPAGLEYSLELLKDFVEAGVSPQQAPERGRSSVDSSQRKWKIRGEPGEQGAYRLPVSWSITAQDVVQAGAGNYIDMVQNWARSILADLRSSGKPYFLSTPTQ